MKIIKRNGSEVAFDITKIIVAITKANEDVDEADRMTPVQIRRIAESVELQCQKMNRAATVEEIQDMVEHHIMAHGAFEVAKHYITYRYTRSLVRRSNTTDDKILSLIECNNEEAKQENSNKNPVVNSTQRDYMAGEVSRDITNRLLLPREIVEAHEEGIIHFHDTDYYAQHMHNCDLVNLEDMLQNGTVITGTLIERPHSFATACNIATQIVAQVASNQYGGQSISLTHLAPFVDVSRRKLRKVVAQELAAIGVDYLQLMRSHSKQAANSREREVAEISAGLKALAKELKVPVIVLAQLNRGPESRTGASLGVPRISDLRESGSIEQDADMIGLLYRSAYYAEDEEKRQQMAGRANLHLAKNRNGPTGDVPLHFEAELMRFSTREADEHDQENE